MANDIALRLDREGHAQMSCIAGVGGDVPALVKVATSGRPMLVIDGCPLQCARHCLRRHGVEPQSHVVLSEYHVKKRRGEYDGAQLEEVYQQVAARVPRSLT